MLEGISALMYDKYSQKAFISYTLVFFAGKIQWRTEDFAGAGSGTEIKRA